MTNLKTIIAAAAVISAVSFSGTAFAEGEYQYTAAPSLASSVVGGGRTVVINTGNPDNPLQVVYLDHAGEQRPVGGRVASIASQDSVSPVYVTPGSQPSGGNPISALAALLTGRLRG